MTPEQERAKAIITSALGKEMPNVANHLAFESDLTAEAALGLMTALKADAGAVVAAQTQNNSAMDASVAEANGLQIVRDGEGAGLGASDRVGGLSGSALAAESWKKAVAAANGSLGIKD
jgi:hypothetical protein